MAINWTVAFRERTLPTIVGMGHSFANLPEQTAGEGGDRSLRGYQPAKFRFERIPSRMGAGGSRLLDDAVNDFAASGQDRNGVGYAFALTIRYYIEYGGEPIAPENSQVSLRQGLVLRDIAFAEDINTAERGLLSDLPLQVQNILLASGLLPPNLRTGSAAPIVPMDGSPGGVTGVQVTQAEFDAFRMELQAEAVAIADLKTRLEALITQRITTAGLPDISGRNSRPFTSMLEERGGSWHFANIAPQLPPDPDVEHNGQFLGVVNGGYALSALPDAPDPPIVPGRFLGAFDHPSDVFNLHGQLVGDYIRYDDGAGNNEFWMWVFRDRFAVDQLPSDRSTRWKRLTGGYLLASRLEDAIEALFRDNFELTDLPGIPDVAVGDNGKLFSLSVDRDLNVSVAFVDQARGGGDDAYDWATVGNTSLIPSQKLRNLVQITDSINPATIQGRIAGEKAGDIVLGYNAAVVALFQYRQAPTNAFVEIARWPRATRTDGEIRGIAEAVVETWARAGSGDPIPGAKTYDGLFKSEQEVGIDAANTVIGFDVGSTADSSVVDETDAEDSSFVITAEQANTPGGFLRVEYALESIIRDGFAPQDVELILQVRDTGALISKHNLADSSGSGHAQFAFGDAGAKRWAIRVVTKGRYQGNVRVTNATFHAGEPRADAAIAHVVHPIVSDEAEKRQEQDKALEAEINRVEAIKAIVNGLPAATATRKNAIAFRSDKVFQQTDADAFQVPDNGFVMFILGNLGTSGLLPVAYCVNRKEIIYAQGNHEVALNFDSQRRAILTAVARGNRLSPLNTDVAPTTTGFVMLHWAPARAG